MKTNAILALFAAAIALSVPAKAQEDPRIISIQYKAADSLDDRYSKCLSEPECPLQLRLQLVDELHLRMGQIMRRVERNCAKAQYRQCVFSQTPDLREWRRRDTQMADMMDVIVGRVVNVAGRDDKSGHEVSREH